MNKRWKFLMLQCRKLQSIDKGKKNLAFLLELNEVSHRMKTYVKVWRKINTRCKWMNKKKREKNLFNLWFFSSFLPRLCLHFHSVLRFKSLSLHNVNVAVADIYICEENHFSINKKNQNYPWEKYKQNSYRKFSNP